MLKVKSITGVDDLQQLGYWDDKLGTEREPIDVYEDGTFEAIKCHHDIKVAITIKNIDDEITIEAYKYKGSKNDHVEVQEIDPTPYIQDLLTACVIELEGSK